MDGMLGCGAALALVLLVLTVALPITSFLRIQRLTKTVDHLRIRLSELEDVLATARASAVPAPAGPPVAATVLAPEAPAEVPVPPVEIAEPPLVVVPKVVPEVLPAAPAAAVPPRAADTLESRIGGQWLLYIGMAALVLSVGFFVKYAFDNAWINETARVVSGVVFGLAAIAAGRRFAARGYEDYGHVLAGGGFVALYVSAWAALNLYGLISRPTTFAAMVAVTAWAAWTADAVRSRSLAAVAVVGGFITPALVGGREDAQVVLLTYVAVLSAGMMLLAARRSWPWLTAVSFGFTFLIFAGWASEHYQASKYAPTQVFLAVFGLMFGWAFADQWRRGSNRAKEAAPSLFGATVALFHLASVANLIDHSLPFLLYLVAFTLAGIAAGVRWDKPGLRLVVFLTAAVPFFIWLDAHNTPGWRVAIIVTAAAMYVMHLAAQGERLSRDDAPIDRADVVLYHASSLAFFAALYRVVDAAWPYSTYWVAIGLAVWQAGLAWRLRASSGDAATQALAAAFAMAGFAIGLRFDDWWALVGWAVEAGAIYWAGLRTNRPWLRLAGLWLLAGVFAILMSKDFFGTPAGFGAFWNPRAGATLAVIAVGYVMAFVLRRRWGADAAREDREYAGLLVGSNILSVLLISAEIHSYWYLRAAEDATADFWMLASLSVAWGIYGTALVIVGIQRRYAPLRYLAITLLLATVGKVFLVDLSELEGVYRIVGFMGLGICLLLGAWLYQRFRDVIIGPPAEVKPPAPPSTP